MKKRVLLVVILFFTFILVLLLPVSFNCSYYNYNGGKFTSLLKAEAKKKSKKITRAEVTKTWWSAYTDSIDTNWAVVTGVIKNTGKTNIEIKSVAGSFYNSSGAVVGSDSDFLYDDILAPGEETYAMIDVIDTVDPEDITNATMRISSKKTNKKPKRLRALNDTGRFNDYEYEVNGELENNTKKKLKNIRAIVMFYDRSGNLVDVEHGWPSPEDLGRSQRASFSIESSHFGEQITNYKIIGVSWQL